MLPAYFDFYLPTRVLYGIHVIDELDKSLTDYHGRRALLVTDKTLVALGIAQRVSEGMGRAGINVVSVFSEVPPDSTLQCVEHCATQGQAAQCDIVIALGGGSVMDTAKVANLLMVKGGEPVDHMGAYLLGDTPLLPLLAIPTTAGTGSEVTQIAVISDPEHNEKLPFAEHQFFPSVAILDPTVTQSLPPLQTAITGMDALTHAIESYTSRQAQPASDALALHVISLVNHHLLRACAYPDDLQARGAMLVAACLAGMAFSQSMVGLAHALSHALGGVYHIPHGLANALVLPEVMAINRQHDTCRFAQIAHAMDIALPLPGQSLALLHESLSSRPLPAVLKKLRFVDGKVEQLLGWSAEARVRLLNRQLASLTGMPLNLADAGVGKAFAELPKVVEKTLSDGALLYNPVSVDAAQITCLLRRVHDQQVQPRRVRIEDVSVSEVTAHDNQPPFFVDSDMLYAVLGGFFQRALQDAKMVSKLQAAGLVVQFRYEQPHAVITLDVSGNQPQVYLGDAFQGKADVIMTMSADFAHRFWCGEENILTALAKRQVKSKGKVPKAVKLLPIIAPVHEQYRAYVREQSH